LRPLGATKSCTSGYRRQHLAGGFCGQAGL